jgi:hypothetical protein
MFVIGFECDGSVPKPTERVSSVLNTSRLLGLAVISWFFQIPIKMYQKPIN